MCQDMTSWPAGSVGNHCSHPWIGSALYWAGPPGAPDHPRGPSMTGWVAPVARTALTRVCIPAVWYPGLLHPWAQHCQVMSCGSL